MRIRAYGNPGRRRWIPVILGLVILGLFGYGYLSFRAWYNRPSEARSVANGVTVAGFVRTSVADVDEGGDASVADAYFIGAAPDPPLSAVTVPTIQLSEIDPPIVAPELGTTVVARGTRTDDCAASVVFLTPIKSAPSNPNWRLTTRQLDDVRKGIQVFIEIHVYNCKL